MAVLDAIHTGNPARAQRVFFSIILLEQTCPNHRHVLLLLQSYEQFHVQS